MSKMNPYMMPGLDIIEHRIAWAAKKTMKVSDEQLKSKSRKQDVVVCRQIIFYMMRQYTPHTFDAIGKEYNRDHSTVMYACKKAKDMIDYKDKYADKILQIKNLIENGTRDSIVRDNQRSKPFDTFRNITRLLPTKQWCNRSSPDNNNKQRANKNGIVILPQGRSTAVPASYV